MAQLYHVHVEATTKLYQNPYFKINFFQIKSRRQAMNYIHIRSWFLLGSFYEIKINAYFVN